MYRNSRILVAMLCVAGSSMSGGTFGRLTTVRGTVSDIAVDESRQVVYAANYTANRIEVISIASGTIESSLQVAAQPSSLSMSPDGRYLAVGHGSPVVNSFSGITLFDLTMGTKQEISTTTPVLTLAFGSTGTALVVTTKGFFLLGSALGSGWQLAPAPTVPDAVPAPGPVPPGSGPLDILRAASGVSADGNVIYAVVDIGKADAESSAINLARLDVNELALSLRLLSTSPAAGPRTVSVDESGNTVLATWALLNMYPRMYLKAQIPNLDGKYSVGGHAIDLKRNVIYADASTKTSVADVAALHVMDPNNLTVRERVRLPQHLGGKSLITRDGSLMASVSQSGVILLPLAEMWKAPRVLASQEDLVFESSFCDRRVTKGTFQVVDPNGHSTDFTISVPSGVPGVRVYPTSGTTPATITVEVDPNAFINQQGTVAVNLELKSNAAVNIPPPLRVLINTKDVDQRGRVTNISGRLVDIVSDPYRERFYVLRQDKNVVLVYNATTMRQEGSMPTGNTPMQMAQTNDGKYLIVGNDNSQVASVLNLETLSAEDPIEFPLGQYPRSVAVAGDKVLATSRSADGKSHKVHMVDVYNRVATPLPTLGVFCNQINQGSRLSASPTGGTIFLAEPGLPDVTTTTGAGACADMPSALKNPGLLLYEATAGTFVAGRADLTGPLTGAAAALSDDLYLVGNQLLDRALVPAVTLNQTTGTSAGAVGLPDGRLLRSSALTTGPGYLERIDPYGGLSSVDVRLIEAPVSTAQASAAALGLSGVSSLGFTNSMAFQQWTQSMLMLSVSGVVSMPVNYDVPLTTPTIQSVVNAANGKPGVAPGGLVRILGRGLTLESQTSGGTPWPGVLGNACVTVNAVPLPLQKVSPTEILAQLPFTTLGTGAVAVRSTAGISNLFNLTISLTSPAVFQSRNATYGLDVVSVVRVSNGETVTFANPIRGEDEIDIYFTGGGPVTGSLQAGEAAPSDPPAMTLSPSLVTLDGVGCPVTFSGLAPGQVGVYKVTAKVPWWVKSGSDVALTLSEGGAATTVAVRVLAK